MNMTVRELIRQLEEFDEDMQVFNSATGENVYNVCVEYGNVVIE